MANSVSNTVIGLDLATKCGWAVLENGKLVDSGRWSLYPNTSKPRAFRWVNFERELDGLVAKYKANVVAFERVRRHAGVGAAHVYGGFLASLERLEMRWPTTLVLPPLVVPMEISTWRKASVGIGSATKTETLRWVKRTFRYNAKTEDEAEAIAIAVAAHNIHGRKK